MWCAYHQEFLVARRPALRSSSAPSSCHRARATQPNRQSRTSVQGAVPFALEETRQSPTRSTRRRCAGTARFIFAVAREVALEALRRPLPACSDPPPAGAGSLPALRLMERHAGAGWFATRLAPPCMPGHRAGHALGSALARIRMRDRAGREALLALCECGCPPALPGQPPVRLLGSVPALGRSEACALTALLIRSVLIACKVLRRRRCKTPHASSVSAPARCILLTNCNADRRCERNLAMRLAGARRGAVSGWVELRPRAAVSAPARRLKRLPAGS